MKIAVLGHVRRSIAPPFAGGMEAHCWNLVAGLQARGHEVVLFASGDSDARFTIDPVLPKQYELTFPWAEHRGSAPLIAYLDEGYAAACDRIAAGGFDVLHNNSLHRFPLDTKRTARIPTVTSLHVPPYEALQGFVHASVAPTHRLTATSSPQLSAWWPAGAPAEASILHNGIDPALWPYVAIGDGSAAWCGRMTPNKAPHLAIDAARRSGIALTLYGPIEDPDYWHTQIVPRLGEGVRHGGHLEPATLAREIGKASVFLFTPCWDEPFGLAAVEAMACGLPVAAFDMGAARQVIGEAGCLAPCGDVAALAGAILRALTIPRNCARKRVEKLFTHERWLNKCEALYEDVRASVDAPA